MDVKKEIKGLGLKRRMLMRFTLQNTINEIMGNEEIRRCIGAFFSASLLSMVPEEYRNTTLEETREKASMPWGEPFMAEEFVNAANMTYEAVTENKYNYISLWKEQKEGYIPDFSANNEENVTLLTLHTDTSKKRPAVIICPGGGYRILAGALEGIQFAERLEAAGYYPFVLYYRVAPNMFPAPQNDLEGAIAYVRSHAKQYNIDPDNLMVMGSSAGAHLCASVAMLHAADPELRPNKVCLNYPVISFMKEMHEDSALALTGNDSNMMYELSVDEHVTSDYPKTFLWACEDDSLVPPSNTKRMAAALEANGVPYEVHLYPTGEHGCGLAKGTSAEGWMEAMLEFMK